MSADTDWRERAYCTAVELLVAVLRVWTVVLEVPVLVRRAVPFLAVVLVVMTLALAGRSA